MLKSTTSFLLVISILISLTGISQEEPYSLELHYSTGICRGFKGVMVSAERNWNLQFDKDSVIFEDVTYKIQHNDTLLRHYLADMAFMMRNNDFLYNDYWLDSWGKSAIQGIYLDGTETIGTITFGQEVQVFNVRSGYYTYSALHQSFFDCFFNTAFYLLTETELNRKIENITFWQLTEFEQSIANITGIHFRKVSDFPLKYRFLYGNDCHDLDAAIDAISLQDTQVIFELDDCYHMPDTADYAADTHLSPDYFKDFSHISWHVYSPKMKKFLIKIGIKKDCIQLIKYPKLGSNDMPKEAILKEFIFREDFRESKLGRSAEKE